MGRVAGWPGTRDQGTHLAKELLTRIQSQTKVRLVSGAQMNVDARRAEGGGRNPWAKINNCGI